MEVYWLLADILHVPTHNHLIALEAVADSEADWVRVFGKRLVVAFEHESGAGVGFLHEREVHIASKSVLRQIVFIVQYAVATFPHATNDRE